MQVLTPSTAWNKTAFFDFGRNPHVAPLETGSLYDMLGTDAYYAGSYSQQRCRGGRGGTLLRGMVFAIEMERGWAGGGGQRVGHGGRDS